MWKAYGLYPSNRSQPDFWTAGILTDLSLQSRNPYWRSNSISHNVESGPMGLVSGQLGTR